NERFALGIAANAIFYQVPFAEWTRQACTPSANCVTASGWANGMPVTETYALTRSAADTHVGLTAGLYPSVGLGRRGEYGAVFGLLGVTQGFSNDGFTDMKSSDGLISTHEVGLVGGGYGFRSRWLHVNVALYAPIAGGDVHYVPGGWLGVGF